jgi:hypothetical protein
MLPFPDQQVVRAAIAQEELEEEVRRLQKIIRKLDAILSSKQPLTSTQRDVLDDLIRLQELRKIVLEGNWYVPDHLHKHGKDK